jgi:hypothetical protein
VPDTGKWPDSVKVVRPLTHRVLSGGRGLLVMELSVGGVSRIFQRDVPKMRPWLIEPLTREILSDANVFVMENSRGEFTYVPEERQVGDGAL